MKDNKNPLDMLPPILKKDLDENICACNAVLKIDVINAILGGANTLEEVKRITFAADGNGCCARQIESLITYLCDKEKDAQ